MSAKVLRLAKRQALEAPHPALQDALFVYATGSDGVNAILIRGWAALVAKVDEEAAGDDWTVLLSDLEEWQTDGWNTPTYYTCDLEGDWISIYRVTEQSQGGAA
ncbi:hypothetical protein [Variovorax sp. UC122_21]|uniref:hypothetical protein n=1 Tax=Variovorax sp. UC122_21 TaxID=3374554 RepID=UPI0037565671